ncbi:hypothetical protein ASD28_14340 [Massilia sp. Root133]|jgi:hypothetical protein|uniref:hypothetical protein n=1 Tax=Massilia sp. Root133 TaxID=1736455 RepID=UPI0006F74BCF|nr:hypothetical protein [Massilia sp. Root133]KQX98290.1 hypothetical protein ASD28_14340 [Massilia sp. Root133]
MKSWLHHEREMRSGSCQMASGFGQRLETMLHADHEAALGIGEARIVPRDAHLLAMLRLRVGPDAPVIDGPPGAGSSSFAEAALMKW